MMVKFGWFDDVRPNGHQVEHLRGFGVPPDDIPVDISCLEPARW